MRTRAVPVALATALVLAGCSDTDAQRPSSPDPGAAPIASSAAPPASLPPATTEELTERVKSAAVELTTEFHERATTPAVDKPGRFLITRPCQPPNSAIRGENQAVGYYRQWEADTLFVGDYIGGYRTALGRQLVSDVRAAVGDCKEYDLSDGRKATILGPMTFDQPAGVDDSFAYCQQLATDSGKGQECVVVIARGHLVTEVTASEGIERSLPAAQEIVRKLIPIAAEALVRS